MNGKQASRAGISLATAVLCLSLSLAGTYVLKPSSASAAGVLTADTESVNWIEVSSTSSPSAREYHTMAYDEARLRVVLFGGQNGEGNLGDTWEWDGTNWMQASSVTSPTARFGHAMAYDTIRGIMVLFGGCDSSGNLEDTWEWDGTHWVQRFPALSPPSRRGHAMVYDSSRGVVVLFGGWGQSGSGYLADTWEWDGANWVNRTSSTAPSARSGHALAYDGLRTRALLFGGRNPNPQNDTWAWDGTHWVKITPLSSPGARYKHALAYDGIRQHIVLFGGHDTISDLNDTWEWDGENWRQTFPPDRPPERTFHAMAFDGGRRALVLFGGSADDQNFDDTWEYRSARLSVSPTTRMVAPGSEALFSVSAEGTSSPTNLTLSTLPLGASAQFHPASIVTPPAQSVLTIRTSSTTPDGLHPIILSAHSNGLTATTSLTLEVVTPDFSLAPSPAQRTVYQGAMVTYTVALTSTATFTAPISMAATGLPVGASYIFSPNPAPSNSATRLQLSAALSTPPGTYELTTIGSGPVYNATGVVTLTRDAPVTLIVMPAMITPTVSPDSRTVHRPETAEYVLHVTTTPRIRLPVALDAGPFPEGIDYAFSPPVISPGESTTLRVITTASTPPGTYEFSITSTVDSLVGAAPAALEVRAPVYLPLITKTWSPLPHQPTLYPIDNTDGDGNYTVAWTELPSRLADTYTLEEATDPAFATGLRIPCETAQQSCSMGNRPAGTYYYRVRGHNSYGYGPYSNVQSATVLPPTTPALYTIDNMDGDGNYTVSWTRSTRATGYTLHEDTVSNFANPTTVYQGASQSWSATGRSPGTYYYRVKAYGPTGQSGWSNVQSVTVPVPAPVVRVLSSTAFVPYSGSTSWYLVGEVRNDTGSNVSYVQISATLRDASGNVVDSDYSYSMIDTLSPGMTSPFRVIFWDPPSWISYDLQVTWDTTSRHPYVLQVLNSTSYFDSYHAYHVVGEIRNQYGEQRTFVKAFVTMYDANGQVIGVDYSYTNPDDLSPAQTASFDTEVYFWKYKPDESEVASHRLQVYDD